MSQAEIRERFLPDNITELTSFDTERFPYINPEFMDRDRLSVRKRPEDGITYEFNEAQLESGLFPGEEKLCGELLDECKKNMPGDTDKVRLALQLSLFGHQRQWRESGEPYTFHPLSIAIEAACE